MKIEDIEGASRLDGSAIRRALQKLQNWATGMELAIGVDPLAPTGSRVRTAPPPLARLTVYGGSGRFVLSIDLPPDAIGPMLHEIKSSDTVPLAASTDIVTFPINPATYTEILAPNITRYFQIRSRYYTSDFNQPKITEAVFSGAA